MKRNSTSSMGAFHPIIFFTLVYAISLFLAIYVCSTVYKTIYGDETSVQNKLIDPNITATAAVDY